MNAIDHRLCLLVSRHCNLRCPFCPVDFTGEDMSLEIARRAVVVYLRHLPRQVAPKIKFFGGEPFLNWPLIRAMVEESRRNQTGAIFQVSTNGMFLDQEKIAFLKEHPEVETTLSFRAAGGAVLPGVWFTLVLTQNQSAQEVIAKMRTLIQDGYRRFNFLPAYFSIWSEEELRELERTFDALKKLFFGLWESGQDYQIKNSEVFSPIPLYNASLTVDTDGSVYSSSLIESRDMESYRDFLRLGSMDHWPKADDPKRDGRILREVLRRWAGSTWDSTMKVDEALSCFVGNIGAYSREVCA